MAKPTTCTTLLHLISILLLHLHQTHAASSPIRNLESSLAASSAHGTVIAVTCTIQHTDDAVLMLARTPTIRSKLNHHHPAKISTTDIKNDSKNDTIGDENDDSMNVLKQASYSKHLSVGAPTSSGMLHILHTESTAPLAIGLTGLSSDVRHLVRSCANVVSQHDMIFDQQHECSSAGNKCLSGYKVVEYLAGRMSNVARVAGARPFGVQALVVGRSGSTVSLMKSNKLSIYTVDPSGGWRKWGGGAAVIGNHSAAVRARLTSHICGNSNEEKGVVDNDDDNGDAADDEMTAEANQQRARDVEEALRLAIQSFLDATSEHEQCDASIGSEQLEAVLISCSSGSRPCRVVSAALVREIYEQCLVNYKVSC